LIVVIYQLEEPSLGLIEQPLMIMRNTPNGNSTCPIDHLSVQSMEIVLRKNKDDNYQYLFHSDFDKTPPTVTVHIPKQLIHKQVGRWGRCLFCGSQASSFFVDLPSVAISMTIGVEPYGRSNRHHTLMKPSSMFLRDEAVHD